MMFRFLVFAALAILNYYARADLRKSVIGNVTYSYILDSNGSAILTSTPDFANDEKLRYINRMNQLPCAVHPKPSGRFVVPSQIDGHKVSKIGDLAFINCSEVTHFVIPETIVGIGRGAFAMCTNVVEVGIPDSVTRIESGAFYHADRLKRLVLPRQLTNLADKAFARCSSIEHIRLTAKIDMENVDPGYFKNMPNLKSLWVEDGVTKLPTAMFSGCHGLSKVRLPKTLKVIGDWCFENCVSLEHLAIPDGLDSIEEYAFAGCSNLVQVTLPTSVVSLAASAFRSTPLLKNVQDDDLAILGSWALGYHGTAPRTIIVPCKDEKGANIKFADGFLAESTSPLDVVVRDVPAAMTDEDVFGMLENVSSMRSLYIEYPAKSWSGWRPLRECRALQTIVLPDSLTNIPYRAFSGCTNLVSVRLPQDWAGNGGDISEILKLFTDGTEKSYSRQYLNAILQKMTNGSHGNSMAETVFYIGFIWGWEDVDVNRFNVYLAYVKDFVKRHPNCYDKAIDGQLNAITWSLRSMIYRPHKHKEDVMHDACIWSLCKLLAAAYDEPSACQWLISHDLERGDVVKRIDFYKRMARHEAKMAVLWSGDSDPDKKNDAREKMLEHIQKIADLGFEQQAQMLQVELETLVRKGEAVQQKENQRVVTGTGWLVATDIIATCAHTIERAREIYVDDGNGNKIQVSLVAKDVANDVAILKLETTMPNAAPLSLRLKGVKVGDKVFTVGYPLSDLLGQVPKYSEGSISALSGMGGDSRFYQISVPIQPGNSGGALVDEFGNVIAITSASLDSLKTATLTGSIPQNVNYAVKVRYLAALLDDAGVDYETTSGAIGREAAIEKVTKATVLVIAE